MNRVTPSTVSSFPSSTIPCPLLNPSGDTSTTSLQLDSGSGPQTLQATGPSDTYVLVIGGLGFIGSHTVLELLKAGKNVIIIDDLSNSFEQVVERITAAAAVWCKANGRQLPIIKFHQLDYRSKAIHFLLEAYSDIDNQTSPTTPHDGSPRLVNRRSRITGVIHFAAFKSVNDSISHPLEYYANNVCGLVNLLELLDHHNIRKFVFSSSATVYGTKANSGRPLREEDVVHHPEAYTDDHARLQHAVPGTTGLLSPYARTKYFGEAILADLAYSSPSWNIIALRYFNPIGCDASGLLGEDPRGEPTNLFPVITQVLNGCRPHLNIFGSDWETRDGTAIRDFIHVSDLARGHVAALEASLRASFRTFNLGTGTGTTVSEAVRALETAAGIKIATRLAPRREGDVGSCVAANSRAVAELSWTATESLGQCARDLWNFVARWNAAASPV